MRCDRVRFSGHALRRMFEREISADDVLAALESREVIESYERDRPFPSRLLLARIGDRALHLVVARDEASATCYIVTVYPPDPELWDDDFRTRRGS